MRTNTRSCRRLAMMAVGVVMATALAACGTSGSRPGHAAATTAGTLAPIPTQTPTVAQVAVPHGPIPRALVGTYTYYSGAWHVTLRGDGTYAQWNPRGQLDITGHYGVTGGLAVFVDEATSQTTGTACDGPGVYTWHFAGKTLVMRVKQDACTVGRQGQWTAVWTKVSSSTLRQAATLAEAQRQ